MGADKIQLKLPLADQMIKAFREGFEQLQDVSQEMQNIGNTLEEGALLGQGGAAFVDAIRGQLCPSIAKLTDKYKEMAEDVLKVIEELFGADEANARRF